eukprot:scaffold275285_cov28-Tisochrysis_lutea.AAC.2
MVCANGQKGYGGRLAPPQVGIRKYSLLSDQCTRVRVREPHLACPRQRGQVGRPRLFGEQAVLASSSLAASS